MNQFQPVRTPRSRLDGHLPLLITLIVGALLLAVIKPWGAVGGAPEVAVFTPSPEPPPSASPPPDVGYAGREYDPSIFGRGEPEAAWAIWPAGYLVTFGFVVQVQGVASPALSPRATSGPQATRRAVDTGPTWPSVLDVPEGNHLLLIGINTPRGFSTTAIRLVRLSAASKDSAMVIERQESPWPDHFTVIGMPSGLGDGLLKVWTPGRYRLDLVFDPGAISRSIEIRIAGASDQPAAPQDGSVPPTVAAGDPGSGPAASPSGTPGATD